MNNGTVAAYPRGFQPRDGVGELREVNALASILVQPEERDPIDHDG